MALPEHLFCSEEDIRTALKAHLSEPALTELCNQYMSDRERWAYASGIVFMHRKQKQKLDTVLALMKKSPTLARKELEAGFINLGSKP